MLREPTLEISETELLCKAALSEDWLHLEAAKAGSYLEQHSSTEPRH